MQRGYFFTAKTFIKHFFLPYFSYRQMDYFCDYPKVLNYFYHLFSWCSVSSKVKEVEGSWGHYVPWIFCSTKMEFKQRRFCFEMYDFPGLDCAQEKNGIPYYSSIFRQWKCPSLSRKIVEIQKFCYHGNVTLHFSTPYLPLVVPV